jgi:hypothetical protein
MANRIRRVLETKTSNAHPLGRHVEHDQRSMMFRVARTAAPIVSVSYKRHGDPFDQGKLGSCTGNAMAGLLITEPFWTPGRVFTEEEAINLYELATTLDEFPGSYPPTDTGSSGIAVAKAAVQEGWFQRYEHAFGLDELLAGMSSRPGILGINWYDSFDSPLPTGECPLTAGARVRGGHEIEMFKVDVEKQQVWCYQSWGETWGGLGDGTFWLSFTTLARLLNEQGDATFPVVPPEPAQVGALH